MRKICFFSGSDKNATLLFRHLSIPFHLFCSLKDDACVGVTPRASNAAAAAAAAAYDDAGDDEDY